MGFADHPADSPKSAKGVCKALKHCAKFLWIPLKSMHFLALVGQDMRIISHLRDALRAIDNHHIGIHVYDLIHPDLLEIDS